jgi:hypothetical protein
VLDLISNGWFGHAQFYRRSRHVGAPGLQVDATLARCLFPMCRVGLAP